MKFFLATLVCLWCVFTWVTYGVLIGLGLEEFDLLEAVLMPVLFFFR